MFEYLKVIDTKLYERYLTLETNIKAQSDSFFDSYLDMLEHLVRVICSDSSIEAQSHESCGAMLGKNVLKLYMLSIGVDETTYEKLKDYSLKVNKHKHKNQKTVTVEQVLSYITAFYEFSSKFAVSKGIAVEPLQNEYFLALFGVLERENATLKSEIKSIDNNVYARLDAIEQGQNAIMNELMRSRAAQMPPPQPQQDRTAALHTIIDFARRSTQYFHFMGKMKSFLSQKKMIYIITALNTAFFLISMFTSYFSMRVFDIGLWFKLLWPFLAFSIFISLNEATLKFENVSFKNSTYIKTEYDSYGILQKKYKKKFIYRWFPRLMCIGSVCNVIVTIIKFVNDDIAVIAIFLEILFVALMYTALKLFYDFYDSYTVYCFTGQNSTGETVTVVYDELMNKWYLEDDFARQFSTVYEK